MALISLTDLGVRFETDRPILEAIDLQIEDGEFVSILGPSGCGKSTLLRVIAGLTPPTHGTVQVGENTRAPRLGFVFQEPALLPWRTVRENIRLPLELDRALDSTREQEIGRQLQRLGLQAKDESKFPRMLSGGMKMRAALARALIVHPQILLFDEPFAALDELLRLELNEDLLRLWGEKRWSAVFVTHNITEAIFLSQRVILMDSQPGRILEEVAVPFEYPRPESLRQSQAFVELLGRVASTLRGNR
ncbi:MAG: ABC transporter ATP-binding protein [Planctomycetota bacterium]|jgi:NitT/TauT family transport system ATP-binding protein|nr:ABC transporter ATP-binding protein [Planctomycetota bacterium]